MERTKSDDPLWEPPEKIKQDANLTGYMRWLDQNLNLQFQTYAELWGWSVENLEQFWQSIWDYFSIIASNEAESVLTRGTMPGVEWFKGARLNYAENFFSRAYNDRPAIVYKDEKNLPVEVSWKEIRSKTIALVRALREEGVGPGDRVVAYMPHIPETIIALFATASIGAIWSSCSPDFGSRSVLDRFQQIEPKILLAVDGYTYGGKVFDRRSTVVELQRGLPTLRQTIIIPQLTGKLSASR